MPVDSGKESLCLWIAKRRADVSGFWKGELMSVDCGKES